MNANAPDLRDKKVAVMGLASTGRAVARFLLEREARVSGFDRSDSEAMESELCPLEEQGLRVKLGPHRAEDLAGMDLIVLSPGVSVHHPVLLELAGRIDVWSEIELASRFLEAPIIGVTGTNGKSTTTTLIGEMLVRGGLKTFVGGNLGTPLIDAIGGAWDWIVCEVSSFQLEACRMFRPRIAVFLNVSDNHLDRHSTLEEYFDAKKKLFENQDRHDEAIINLDDPLLGPWAPQVPGRLEGFSRTREIRPGGWATGTDMLISLYDREERYPLAEAALKGGHNVENMLASILAARLAGCPSQAVRGTLSSFRGLPHRLEKVDVVRGVEFYDDSKATNVDAVRRAVESVGRPSVLILGGLDKGGDFGRLAEIASSIRKAVVMGAAGDRIGRCLAGRIEFERASDMGDAVNRAFSSAVEGDAVLLSPGCASFDMFKNYEDRGEKFREAVRRLKEHATASERGEGNKPRPKGKNRKKNGGRRGSALKGEHEANIR